MDIIVVGTANHDSTDILVWFALLVCVDLLEMGEGLENGLPVVVVFSLLVGPLCLECLGGLLLEPRVSVHHPC